jgi:hypothetical protein
MVVVHPAARHHLPRGCDITRWGEARDLFPAETTSRRDIPSERQFERSQTTSGESSDGDRSYLHYELPLRAEEARMVETRVHVQMGHGILARRGGCRQNIAAQTQSVLVPRFGYGD